MSVDLPDPALPEAQKTRSPDLNHSGNLTVPHLGMEVRDVGVKIQSKVSL
jgi:hypothetical protein